MQDSNFLEYYKGSGDYKLLPRDMIETQIDGKGRVIKIDGVYHHQGIVCCNGCYMDDDNECFINLPQDVIIFGAVRLNHKQ